MTTEYYHLYKFNTEVEHTICSHAGMAFSEYASWKGTHSWKAFREHQLVFAVVIACGIPTDHLAISSPPCPECIKRMPAWADSLRLHDLRQRETLEGFGG